MRLKECEYALPCLLSGHVPNGNDELVAFQDKKKDLMVELDQLRVLDERT